MHSASADYSRVLDLEDQLRDAHVQLRDLERLRREND
jgi:hypothetical protein